MKQSKNKASALIVSIMILSIILIIALSVALNAARERVSSIGSAKSSQSLQSADTGIEKVMFELSQISDSSDTVLDASFSNCNGDTGLIEEENGEYSVEFRDTNGDKIDCDDGTSLVSDIFSLKSVGVNSGTERAISAQFPKLANPYAIDSETKLLIHSDTTDGSTSFEDSGGGDNSPHSITPNGNVHHETDESYFGTTSIYFDGSGDYLSMNDNEDWDFGTEDFTIDFWFRPTEDPAASQFPLATTYFSGGVFDGGYYIAFNPSKHIQFVSYSGNTVQTNKVWVPSPAITLSTWNHLAFVKTGGNLILYINGSSQGPVVNSYSIDSSATSHPLTIGAIDVGGYTAGFDGYIDELRISKGIARWTSDFTPPTREYTLD